MGGWERVKICAQILVSLTNNRQSRKQIFPDLLTHNSKSFCSWVFRKFSPWVGQAVVPHQHSKALTALESYQSSLRILTPRPDFQNTLTLQIREEVGLPGLRLPPSTLGKDRKTGNC